MGSITTRHRRKLPPYLPPRPRNVDPAIWLPASHERTNPLRARYDHVTATLPHRNDPSPEEIAVACEAIQATWSDGERERRKVVGADPLVAEMVTFAELVGALAG